VVGGQRQAPAALPQERDPVTTVQEDRQVLVPDWMSPENFVLTGVRTVMAYYPGICLGRLGISNCQDNMWPDSKIPYASEYQF